MEENNVAKNFFGSNLPSVFLQMTYRKEGHFSLNSSSSFEENDKMVMLVITVNNR